jgi:hypothetical protein
MRIAARKTTKTSGLRRERLLSDRTRSPALRSVFPQIGQLRIELTFRDEASAHTPSPQQHTLYPSAPAFFRFACPCADCDGDFDLTPAVVSLVEARNGRRPPEGSTGGQLSCQGVRLREMGGQRPCSMQLSFRLSVAASVAKAVGA